MCENRVVAQRLEAQGAKFGDDFVEQFHDDFQIAGAGYVFFVIHITKQSLRLII